MGNVLFIDDELMILSSIKRTLKKEKYNKYFAESAEEAFRIMGKTKIDLVVTDMRMPKTSGLDLLRKIKVDYPNTVRIVLSGYSQLPQIIATINQGDIFKFILKPWESDEELKKIINEGLEYANLIESDEKNKKLLESRNEIYISMLNKFNYQKDILIKDIEISKNISKKFKELYIDNIEEKNGYKDMLIRDLFLYENRIMEKMPHSSDKIDLSKLAKSMEDKLKIKVPGINIEVGVEGDQIIYGSKDIILDTISSIIERIDNYLNKSDIKILIREEIIDESLEKKDIVNMNISLEYNNNIVKGYEYIDKYIEMIDYIMGDIIDIKSSKVEDKLFMSFNFKVFKIIS